jgi:hypothetical protein
LHDVVQLAGGKLQDRLLHSHCADDRVRWRRNLKRDIEYGLRDGLYFEPTRVSDKLLSTILPNWKIRRAAVRFRWHVAPFQVPVPQRRFPPPWSVEETRRLLHRQGRQPAGRERGRPLSLSTQVVSVRSRNLMPTGKPRNPCD